MGKWGKYLKHYNAKWQTEKILKDWLQPSSEQDVLCGKPDAYCKVCKCHLRAHHTDLVTHAGPRKHTDKMKSLNRTEQPDLRTFGVSISDQSKILDLKLAVFISMHCAVKSMDHLGEMLKRNGKGTAFENLKLHRTKCSKLICNVIAPAFLDELVKDIGTSKYAVIADESTDVSITKFLAVCVRYYRKSQRKMVTGFLGIIQVTNCTGKVLARALRKYLATIKLALKQMRAIGTDGAPNMCGLVNSMYTHLKIYIPDLELVKCICHSIDKCASYASKELPDSLEYLLQEIPFYFTNSTKRWNEYVLCFQKSNAPPAAAAPTSCSQEPSTSSQAPPTPVSVVPKKFVKLCKTRWLICLPAVTVILEQWSVLKKFFGQRASGNDYRAKYLSELLNDDSNLLLLTFLRTVLQNVQAVNLAFESTDTDVTKIFSDLRSLVFSLASRILKPSTIPQTPRPGVLRVDEASTLKAALHVPDNLLPFDRVNVGDAFKTLLACSKTTDEDLTKVYQQCGSYIFKLCLQLLERMPPNLAVISKIRNFSPRLTLARIGRPTFHQLPLELLDSSADRDLSENQWILLGTVPASEICPHSEYNDDLEKMDIVHFWACALECKDAGGQQPFKELATFALNILTIPISNAVVERVFSFLNAIKTKERSKMQLAMLESLIRLRVHLKVNKMCCKDFERTKEMLRLFTCRMYEVHHDVSGELDEPVPVPQPMSSASEPDPPIFQESDSEEAVDDPGAAAPSDNQQLPSDLDTEDYVALEIKLFDQDDIGACVSVITDL